MQQPSSPRRARNVRPLSELVERAGLRDPSVQPVIVARGQSGRPGWELLTVSLRPGQHVDVLIRSGLGRTGELAAILDAVAAHYAPAGLRRNPWDPEEETA